MKYHKKFGPSPSTRCVPFGIGVILIALSLGYCDIRRSHKDRKLPQG